MAVLTNSGGAQLTTNAGKVIVRDTGSILQVGQGTTQSSSITSSQTFQSTNLFKSITPLSSTNKVLVFVNINSTSSVNGHTIITVYRDGTNLGDATWGFSSFFTGGQIQGKNSFQYLDSPGTTSSIEYKVYFRVLDPSMGSGDVATRGLNVITLMEIAG
jgi:hypothetical protein